MITEEEIKSIYKTSREIYEEVVRPQKVFANNANWEFSKNLESLNIKNPLLKVVLIRQKNMSEYIKQLEQQNKGLREDIKNFREKINDILEN